MGHFRKSSRSYVQPSSCTCGMIEVTVPKQIATKGGDVVSMIERKRITVEEYEKTLGMPKDENYQLRDMLAAGVMPETVNVSGMLDSTDPTDIKNVGVADALLGKVMDAAQKTVSEPSVAVSEPEPTNSPSE